MTKLLLKTFYDFLIRRFKKRKKSCFFILKKKLNAYSRTLLQNCTGREIMTAKLHLSLYRVFGKMLYNVAANFPKIGIFRFVSFSYRR